MAVPRENSPVAVLTFLSSLEGTSTRLHSTSSSSASISIFKVSGRFCSSHLRSSPISDTLSTGSGSTSFTVTCTSSDDTPL